MYVGYVYLLNVYYYMCCYYYSVIVVGIAGVVLGLVLGLVFGVFLYLIMIVGLCLFGVCGGNCGCVSIGFSAGFWGFVMFNFSCSFMFIYYMYVGYVYLLNVYYYMCCYYYSVIVVGIAGVVLSLVLGLVLGFVMFNLILVVGLCLFIMCLLLYVGLLWSELLGWC